MRKDGAPIFVAGQHHHSTMFQRETVVLAYVRDIAARRQVEDDFRQLSRRLLEGIEEKSKRLAADLHDEFGPAPLMTLHFGVEALASPLETE
jgi:signal transduction histidine kinase